MTVADKKFKFGRAKCHKCKHTSILSSAYQWKYRGETYYLCTNCCDNLTEAVGYYDLIFYPAQLGNSIPDPLPAHWPNPDVEETQLAEDLDIDVATVNDGIIYNDLNMTPEQLGEPRDEAYVAEQAAENVTAQLARDNNPELDSLIDLEEEVPDIKLCDGGSCDGCQTDDPYSTPRQLNQKRDEVVVREATPMQEASSSDDFGGPDSGASDDY